MMNSQWQESSNFNPSKKFEYNKKQYNQVLFAASVADPLAFRCFFDSWISRSMLFEFPFEVCFFFA